MLLEEVVVHNFGAYRGRHTLVLSPPIPDKPVILIGGLNGTGKTTLLDALQLALYGNLARCASRGSLNYNEFLQRSINRTVAPTEGAALELQFRHTADGSEHSYRIHRSWSATASGIRERTDIILDGKTDRVLSDSWSEYVQDFMPSRLSHLFFFDGEKIEALADLENSRQILATAIHSLLGLDLVDRLGTDLIVLERRKLVALKSESERQQIDALKQQADAIQEQVSRLSADRASAQNEFDRRQKDLADLEERFRTEGGDLFVQRNELEAKRSALEKRLAQIEEEMREVAAGPSPLLSVIGLLAAIDIQADLEDESHRAKTIDAFLLERDTKLLRKVRNLGVSKDILPTLSQFLEDDRAKLAERKKVQSYLDLEPQSHSLLRSLRGPIFRETKAHIRRLTQQCVELRSSLVDIERRLAATPDRDSVSRLVEQREDIKINLQKSRTRLELFDGQLDRLRREQEVNQNRLTAELEKTVRIEFEKDASTRMVNHSAKVRSTLIQFRIRVVERHLARIEKLILESFQQLLRKQFLITAIKISPDDYTLQLTGADGQDVPTERLSAGERQLLAVSILWGLARASRRTLPSVIDTPLGRLDGTHRDHLVERYFPNVSHQVLLLSTDMEIDKHYYDKLKPRIGRSYRLDVDEPTGNARVESGYFW